MDNEITIDVDELLKLPDGSITDSETCRQIGLATTNYKYLSKEKSIALGRKIKPMFGYQALYPHVQTKFDVFPDGISCETKKMLSELIKEHKNK